MDNLIKEFNQPEKEQFAFLSEFAKKHQPRTILEIGTGWGLSACAFLLNSNATLVTIDPREKLEDFERRTKMVGVRDRITKVTGRSGKNCQGRHKSEKANLLETFKQKFDLIYIDGSHEYDDVYYDVIHCLELTDKYILADDYFHKDNFGGSYGVAKAISQIAKLKNFSYLVHPVAHGMVEISLNR
jgi:predicted O-methyltransferase YrrM